MRWADRLTREIACSARQGDSGQECRNRRVRCNLARDGVQTSDSRRQPVSTVGRDDVFVGGIAWGGDSPGKRREGGPEEDVAADATAAGTGKGVCLTAGCRAEKGRRCRQMMAATWSKSRVWTCTKSKGEVDPREHVPRERDVQDKTRRPREQ